MGDRVAARYSTFLVLLTAMACHGAVVPPLTPRPRIHTGGTGSCATSEQGDTYCWGRLGPSDGAPVRMTDSVGAAAHFLSFEYGIWRGCGQTVSAVTMCTWGAAAREPTDTTIRLCPSDTCTFELKRADLHFAIVTTGLYHSCGLTRSGVAYCWGNSNGMGQLGLGWITPDSTGSGGPIDSRPRRVAGRLRFRAISAGDNHTCALTFAGEVFCWGYGQSGQLGIASVKTYCNGKPPYANSKCSIRQPTRVPTALRFLSISAGTRLTCGVATDSTAYCWGNNYRCALGTCRTPDSATPARIVMPGAVKQVAAGYFFACAVAFDARAYCWGDNAWGQLGSLVTTPGDACFLGGRCSPTPQEVAGDHRWVALAAGQLHACGITVEGRVYCWGSAEEGRVGPDGGGTVCENHSTQWKDVPCRPEPVAINGVPILLALPR